MPAFYRVFVAVLVCAAVAACQTITLVEAGKPVVVAKTFRVQPQIAWSKIQSGGDEIWTVHGPLLHYIRFIKAIEDGEELFKVRRRSGEKSKTPVFKSGMSPLEIAEVFETTRGRSGAQNMKIADLRPQKLGSENGFRFAYTFATKDGLLKNGFAVGFEKAGKLHMIVFEGASVHYFPTYKNHVERIVETIEIL